MRVVEMSNIGPGPFCGMLLADMGAQVLRVARLSTTDLGFDIEPRFDLLNRGKQAVAIDLKSADGIETVKRLIASADILIEGFRPGVMERLGLGPDVCLGISPALVFGRLTGWGQSGAYAQMAGHDINYIALSGALAAIGDPGGAPVPPLNLVGDFAAGSLYLAMGLLAALHASRASGKGQVIDGAMLDGAVSLMTMHLGYRQAGIWSNTRGSNSVDGGSPFYTTYPTSDGKFMAVGAVEARFYRIMLDILGLADADLPRQNDQSRWGELRAAIAGVFATKTRAEWTALFDGTDACVSPILDMDEMKDHPVVRERALLVETDGVVGPAPAPRFAQTPGAVRHGTLDPAVSSREALKAWGIPEATIATLAEAGIIPAGPDTSG
ncbi:CoA transferase [Novosphingobium colocasiae]|uniref:CoA transferase n=1 Tax=Novosphingobium colocasiae TaxID=1256513 RepID=A0A918PK43_9SPHN|nr:CoA transferase [Novosphingobium colocasiae]